MRLLALRIAWSVICGAACLMFVALWVRSDEWLDQVSHSGARTWYVSSYQGRVFFEQEFFFDEISQDMTPREFAPCGYELSFYAYPAGDVVLGDAGFGVPDWAVVGAMFFAGVLPWFALPRQFSLRALLVVMTAVAIVLGGAIYI